MLHSLQRRCIKIMVAIWCCQEKFFSSSKNSHKFKSSVKLKVVSDVLHLDWVGFWSVKTWREGAERQPKNRCNLSSQRGGSDARTGRAEWSSWRFFR